MLYSQSSREMPSGEVKPTKDNRLWIQQTPNNNLRLVAPCDRFHDDDISGLQTSPLNHAFGNDLFVSDVQHLVMSAIFPQQFLTVPRWCQVRRPGRISSIVFLCMDQVDLLSVEKEVWDPLTERWFGFFTWKETIIPSSTFEVSTEKELFLVPTQSLSLKARIALDVGLSVDSTQPLVKLMGMKQHKMQALMTAATERLQKAKLKPHHDQAKRPREEPPKSSESEIPVSMSASVISRLDLLMSKLQMEEMNFPTPEQSQFAHFTPSRAWYHPVHSASPLWSIDCEMVLVAGGEMALARIALVDEERQLRYHELVRPRELIVDYVTRLSGISADLLSKVDKRLEDVRLELQTILPPDVILVGHSLENDLKALKMFHPYVIDTSVIYNLTGLRQRKPKLQTLAAKFLKREIQRSATGHCPTEDALAALDLVLLKMDKGITFGDRCAYLATGGQQPREEDLTTSPPSLEQQLSSQRERYLSNHARHLRGLSNTARSLVDILYHSQRYVKIVDSDLATSDEGKSDEQKKKRIKKNRKKAGDWMGEYSFVMGPQDENSIVHQVVVGAQKNRLVYARLRNLERSITEQKTEKAVQQLQQVVLQLVAQLDENSVLIFLLKDACFAKVIEKCPLPKEQKESQPPTRPIDRTVLVDDVTCAELFS